MILIKNLNNSEPYEVFKKYYVLASDHNQIGVEAILIASFDKDKNEVDGRFVNLKYIDDQEWTFFSNYNSPKSKQFLSHSQISAIFHWNSINVQIRIQANICKSEEKISDEHFLQRSKEKNALSISSSQSKTIDSYDDVIEKYNKAVDKYENEQTRPDYWGGYTFKPYSFEFWEGHKSRINKRTKYTKVNNSNKWEVCTLEP